MNKFNLRLCFRELEVLPSSQFALVGAKCQNTNKEICLPIPLEFVRNNSELFFTGQPLELELSIVSK